MSTRSLVGRLINENEVEYIYVHHDGYLKGVGAALVAEYNTEEKVRALLAEGDHSSIAGGRESYKDRGETGVDADTIRLRQYVPGVSGAEYVYLFQDGEWFYKRLDYKEWHLVKEQI